jgi:hypothetical protein
MKHIMFQSRIRLFRMPSYYSLSTPNYNIYVEPTGIRKYMRSLPYLSGGFLIFDLYAYDKHPKSMELEYEWRILRKQENNNRYSAFDNKKDFGAFREYAENRQWTLWSRLIITQVSASGQYILQLRIEDEMRWSTIVDFEQLSRDRVTFNILMATYGIVTAAIGGVIGWALTR